MLPGLTDDSFPAHLRSALIVQGMLLQHLPDLIAQLMDETSCEGRLQVQKGNGGERPIWVVRFSAC